MREADGMCDPVTYNLFVFVAGRFAGVLSPVPMTSRLDASSGPVRMQLPVITAEFARYTGSDALCCPSSRMSVRYRLDTTPDGPVVVPRRDQDDARTLTHDHLPGPRLEPIGPASSARLFSGYDHRSQSRRRINGGIASTSGQARGATTPRSVPC